MEKLEELKRLAMEAENNAARSAAAPTEASNPAPRGTEAQSNTSKAPAEDEPEAVRRRVEATLSEAREAAAGGKLETADDLLEEARRQGGAAFRTAVANAAGEIAQGLRQKPSPDDALRFARVGLSIDPEAPLPRCVLGDLAHDRNDLNAAISEWELGLRLNPGHALLMSRLASARKEVTATRGFRKESSTHFWLAFDGEEDAAVVAFTLESLEAARTDVGKLFDLFPEERVAVMLYPTKTFEGLQHRAEWTSAFYDGKLHIPTGGAMSHRVDFQRTLAHEYAHALFHRATGGVRAPAWLNEGLAQLAENPSVITSCGFGHLAPLRQLHGPFMRLNAAQAQAAYPTAHHAVEGLWKARGAAGIQMLLREIKRGVEFERAFESFLGKPYARFAEAFDRQEGCQ
ncbi:MAG: hypothetical protein HYZ28_20745 [Myxococcales bacterium]|nr:hypothetical protein [Myxococcales bacterium]